MNSRGGQGSGTGAVPGVSKVRGRQLLDHEALTCLLVLLFMDEPKLNTSRLFRVLRNLCYHAPTRTWILRALLSILQRTAESHPDEHTGASSGPTKPTETVTATPVDKKRSKGANNWSHGDSVTRSPSSWLSISLDAALGCRANVFQVQRGLGSGGGKKSSCVNVAGSGTAGGVNIHPQAAPVVCRHVLDTLISLAKVFPSHFLPGSTAAKAKDVTDDKDKDNAEHGTSSTPQPKPKGQGSSSGATSPRLSRSDKMSSASSGQELNRQESDFWWLLMRLDSASLQGKKGKGVQRPNSSTSVTGESESLGYDYASCALGQLMSMLSHPVVRRSQQLTDRLLRLLGLISVGLQDGPATSVTAASSSCNNPPLSTVVQASSNPSTTTTSVTAAAASTTLPTITPPVTNGSAAPAAVSAGPAAAAQAAQATTPCGSEAEVKSVVAEDKNTEAGASQEDPILIKELKMAVQVHLTLFISV